MVANTVDSLDLVFIGIKGELFHKDVKITDFDKLTLSHWNTYDRKLGIFSEPIKSRIVVELEGVYIDEEMMILLGYKKIKGGFTPADTSDVTIFSLKAPGKSISGKKADGSRKIITVEDVYFPASAPMLYSKISLKGNATIAHYKDP